MDAESKELVHIAVKINTARGVKTRHITMLASSNEEIEEKVKQSMSLR